MPQGSRMGAARKAEQAGKPEAAAKGLGDERRRSRPALSDRASRLAGRLRLPGLARHFFVMCSPLQHRWRRRSALGAEVGIESGGEEPAFGVESACRQQGPLSALPSTRPLCYHYTLSLQKPARKDQFERYLAWKTEIFDSQNAPYAQTQDFQMDGSHRETMENEWRAAHSKLA